MATNLPFTGIFKVTQEYGKKGSYKAGYHTGIDLIGTDKTIYSVCNGIVILAKYYGNYGNCVKIRDSQTKKVFLFAHLKTISVKKGQTVNRTTKIGIMGNTGNSRGEHLHLELRTADDIYGNQENPAMYLGIPNVVGTYNSANYQLHKEQPFYVGQKVLVDIPIQIATKEGNFFLVDDNKRQFWIHESVITEDNRVYGIGTICFVSNDSYIVQIFDDKNARQFWVDKSNLTDNF